MQNNNKMLLGVFYLGIKTFTVIVRCIAARHRAVERQLTKH